MKTAEEILKEVLPYRPNFVDIETKYYFQFAKQIAELAFIKGHDRGYWVALNGVDSSAETLEQFIKQLFGEK
jgi:hypothetical protein